MKRTPKEGISTTGTANPSGTTGIGSGGKPIPSYADLERYLDFTVVDPNDDKIGTIDAIWEDHTGQPAYLGVKTGWLGLGRTHVIPVHSADVSETTRKVRLPFSVDVVKNAPAFDEQSEIDDAGEREIEAYYRQHGFKSSKGMWRSGIEPTPAERAATLRRETGEDVRMPVSQEQVNIGKREVEGEGVRLRKIVRTETVNQPVDLEREEIVVERVPAKDRTPTRADKAFREEEIYIPLRREEPVIEKHAEATEDVHVSKQKDVEHRDVSETVRKEDVEVDRTSTPKKRPDDRPL
jgi:uncharacterized protein (TIGR02271 family)